MPEGGRFPGCVKSCASGTFHLHQPLSARYEPFGSGADTALGTCRTRIMANRRSRHRVRRSAITLVGSQSLSRPHHRHVVHIGAAIIDEAYRIALAIVDHRFVMIDPDVRQRGCGLVTGAGGKYDSEAKRQPGKPPSRKDHFMSPGPAAPYPARCGVRAGQRTLSHTGFRLIAKHVHGRNKSLSPSSR